MRNALKWILAAAFAVLGLLLSFALPPTIFECRLFTACHQVNVGYAIVSIFSSEASSTLAHEQIMLQIAHSVALTLIPALVGFFVGVLIPLALTPSPHPLAVGVPFRQEANIQATRIFTAQDRYLELNGLGDMHEYYLKIEIGELAAMSGGFTVGREEAGFTIGDKSLSHLHALLRARGSDFTVEDAGSTNGTRLNSRKLGHGEQAQLRAGDRLSFGAADFSVQLC